MIKSIEELAKLLDPEAWESITDGRDELPFSLWEVRRKIALQKAKTAHDWFTNRAKVVDPFVAYMNEVSKYFRKKALESSEDRTRWSFQRNAELSEEVATVILAQAQLIAEAEHANRTRPDYNLRCEECGRAHIIDTSLPSETWNKIAQPGDVLCATCIDDRLQKAGLTAEAEFYYSGSALNGRMYENNYGTVQLLTSCVDEMAQLLREIAEDNREYAESGEPTEERAAITHLIVRIDALLRNIPAKEASERDAV